MRTQTLRFLHVRNWAAGTDTPFIHSVHVWIVWIYARRIKRLLSNCLFFSFYYSSTSSFSFVFSRYFFYGSFLWLLWTQRPLTNVYVQRGLFMITFLCGAKINSTSKCTSTTMTRERVTHSVMRFTNKRVNTYICIRTIKCMQKFTFSVFFYWFCMLAIFLCSGSIIQSCNAMCFFPLKNRLL